MADISGRPSPWPTLGKLIGTLVAAGVLVAGVFLPYVGGLGLAAKHESEKFLNTTCTLQENAPPEPSTIYANDGKTVIARIFTQDRQPVPLSAVPKSLQEALIATEDRRFYSHHGVDMRGLIRSALTTSSGDTQGGSTLTMQYVKQVRYYDDIGNLAAQQADISQTLSRKMEDAQCAIQLEKHESKPTILQNYLNIAYFGENAYSIQSAAETYFDENVSQLTIPQSAMLVGLLQAPSAYDPFVNIEAAKTRRNEVLQNLVAVGDLTQAQASAYQATPIQLATKSPPIVQEGCANANSSVQNVGFFCDYVVNWLESVDGVTSTQLNTGGLKIITTLNANLQNSAQTKLAAKMPASAAMTAVMPVVDPTSGNVLAMVSNKNYGNPTSDKDNTHTTLPNFTLRSAAGASTYKLFSLLAALQTGVPATWSVDTYGVAGAATQTYVPNGCYGATPKYDTVSNGDANVSYNRTESLTTATAKSSNTFFVAMDDQLFGCDLEPVVSMAEQLGMGNLTATVPSSTGKITVGQQIINNQSILQIVLGSGLATSPLDLAGAYAAVADGGLYHAPAPVLSVIGPDGKPLPVKRSPPVRVLAPQVAAQAVQILTGDTDTYYGTSYDKFTNWYLSNGSPIAGKTGTAVDSKGTKNSALWFVGMTPNYAAALAVINPAAPSNPIPALPGFANPGSNAYGDFAAGLWLAALQPTIATKHWSWPNPNAIPGLVQVPDVTGLDPSAARTQLAAQGFKMTVLDAADQLECASAVPMSMIAFYGPQMATKGSVITVCPSSGVAQSQVPIIKPKPSPTPSGSSSNRSPGGGSSSGGGSSRTPSPTPAPSRTRRSSPPRGGGPPVR